MNIQDQISEARQQGYTDSEISQFLTQNGKDVSNLGLQADQGSSSQTPNNWSSFVDKATQLAKIEDFPVSVLIGQAALESGRGESGLTTEYNNYFGIKGKGPAGEANLPTQEADQNGKYYSENSNFRAYQTPEQSILDYINLIKNNYSDAYAKKSDPFEMLKAIKADGYATSPDYVVEVASTPEFQQFYGEDRQAYGK